MKSKKPTNVEHEKKKAKMVEQVGYWSESGRSLFTVRDLAEKYEVCTRVVTQILSQLKVMPLRRPKKQYGWSESKPYMSHSAQQVCQAMNQWRRS